LQSPREGQGMAYKLSDAVTLFSQTTSSINTLWAVYVAATFAAAGFGASSTPLNAIAPVWAAAAVTLGFWAFALGHLVLLMQALSVTRVLGTAICDVLAATPAAVELALKPVLERLVSTANPPWISMAIHLFIDACVTASIWIRIWYLNI
jgi:hypothetical protein